MSRSLIRTLVALLAGAALAVGLQAREGVDANPGLYRYAMAQSTASSDCPYDYVEMGAGGRSLALSSRPGAATDDGGAVLGLQVPMELYQSPIHALVVSGNGYLAAAGSLEEDDGSDFSNDCELPVLANNFPASQNRIYVYHDDLRPRAGGSLRQAYFPTCPRTGESNGPEACTVIEWNGFERAGPIPSTVPLVAQAVLYHDSHEIALQYASVDDSLGGQATVGLQGLDGRAARTLGCNAPRLVRARQAVCFFDPRQRPDDGLLLDTRWR